MSNIFNKVRELDENNSDNVKETISTFVQHLSKVSGDARILCLTTLEDVIHRFPKYCFPHRSNIELYLVKYLYDGNYHSVIAAAKCAHLIQQGLYCSMLDQVRPSQEKTATAKTCWREQMSLLCEAAHSLLSAIFTDAVDVYHTNNYAASDKESTLSHTPLSKSLAHITEVNSDGKRHDGKDKHDILCVRLRNVFVFIQAMLVERYPIAKPIRPQTILDVIVRAITVTSSKINNLTSLSDIIQIKNEALRTLDALILCLQSNLIPFSPLIFRIVMQTLRWTESGDSEESSKVRINTYATLRRWLNCLHCHAIEATRRDAKGKSLEDELCTAFVADITPVKHVVTLTLNAQPTKNMSKKAKRKLAASQLQASSIASHMPGANVQRCYASDDMAIAALECLETFLIVCGIFLKPTTHKIIQSTLVRECLTAHTYSAGRVLRLCRALDAARQCTASNVPPPTQHCANIFSRLVVSTDPEISRFCSQALLNIRLHLHCAPPSLIFVSQPTPVREREENSNKAVSERNRAALEALLGVDKVPKQKSEEVITILDEPSTKKPRLDEDNISISSQSSIEITDDDGDGVEEVDEILEINNDHFMNNEKHQDIEIVDKIAIATTNDNIAIDTDDDPIIIEDRTGDPIINSEKIIKSNPKEVFSTKTNLNELVTQIPVNVSNDTVDGQESSSSNLEIDFDYFNTVTSKVTVLDKLDDDNLPSTNETDDIQITCGQHIKSSQEVSQKKADENKENEPKLQINGDVSKDANMTETVTVTIAANDVMTVDDMLADFVDEVNDEIEV